MANYDIPPSRSMSQPTNRAQRKTTTEEYHKVYHSLRTGMREFVSTNPDLPDFVRRDALDMFVQGMERCSKEQYDPSLVEKEVYYKAQVIAGLIQLKPNDPVFNFSKDMTTAALGRVPRKYVKHWTKQIAKPKGRGKKTTAGKTKAMTQTVARSKKILAPPRILRDTTTARRNPRRKVRFPDHDSDSAQGMGLSSLPREPQKQGFAATPPNNSAALATSRRRNSAYIDHMLRSSPNTVDQEAVSEFWKAPEAQPRARSYSLSSNSTISAHSDRTVSATVSDNEGNWGESSVEGGDDGFYVDIDGPLPMSYERTHVVDPRVEPDVEST